MSIVVRQAITGDDVATFFGLVVAQREHLGIDPGFQHVDAEPRVLPGGGMRHRVAGFSSPRKGGVPLGCVALCAVGTGRAEMKRLFVCPEGRGRGVGHDLGRTLVARVLGEARAIGYPEVRLDALSSMVEAQQFCARFGFRDIPPYAATPIAGTRFLAFVLTSD